MFQPVVKTMHLSLRFFICSRWKIEALLKGELLWQGDENFYIVKSNYKRTIKNPEAGAEVFSINSNKEDKSFDPSYTLPIKGLLSINDELISDNLREIIIDFINSNLLSHVGKFTD